MPIKNLSNQRRMPRLGKVRLGIKVTNADGIEYPKATDYFVVEDSVKAVFGEKPTELEIMFPVEDETLFAPQYYKSYNKSFGLSCKGDGETAVQRFDTKTGKPATKDSRETSWRDVPCLGQECPIYKAKKCTEVMNLQFLLPKVPGLGVWQLDTGSYYGILEINSGIDLVRNVCGRVSMIPLKLSLGKQEVTPPGEKKITVNVLKLSANVTLAETQRLAQLPPSRVLLPPPDESELLLMPGDFPEADELMEKAKRLREAPPPPEEDMDALWGNGQSKEAAPAVPVNESTGEIIEATVEAYEQPEAPPEESSDEAFDKMESASPRAAQEARIRDGFLILGIKKPKAAEMLRSWNCPASAADCTDEQLNTIEAKINELVNLR
ncbi:MAG: hypothetical protein P3T54_00065 [Dehalogenimonas sp.]|nr:hypothetical protein [Dehalogenimonas sp.]